MTELIETTPSPPCGGTVEPAFAFGRHNHCARLAAAERHVPTIRRHKPPRTLVKPRQSRPVSGGAGGDASLSLAMLDGFVAVRARELGDGLGRERFHTQIVGWSTWWDSRGQPVHQPRVNHCTSFSISRCDPRSSAPVALGAARPGLETSIWTNDQLDPICRTLGARHRLGAARGRS